MTWQRTLGVYRVAATGTVVAASYAEAVEQFDDGDWTVENTVVSPEPEFTIDVVVLAPEEAS